MGSCTSGFNVKVNGVRGITTAAHCPDNLSDDGDALTFQDKHHGSYGDVQWHTGPDTMGHSFYAGSISVLETDQRQVTGVGTARIGDTLCRNGQMHYQDCQEVRRINVCAVWVCRLVSMQHYYAADGDSGAPVFMGTEAFGVHRGKTWFFGWREIFSPGDIFRRRDLRHVHRHQLTMPSRSGAAGLSDRLAWLSAKARVIVPGLRILCEEG